MRQVTLKNIWAHKIRLILVSSIITFGVAFVAGSFILGNTLTKSFNDLFANAYEQTDVVVRDAGELETDFGALRGNVGAEVIPIIQRVPDVTAVEGYSQSYAEILDKNGDTLPGSGGAPAFGSNWINDSVTNAFSLEEGRAPQSDTEIVIDRSSATAAEYRVGDTTTVLSSAQPSQYTIVGIAKFGTADSTLGSRWVFFTQDRAQQLFNQIDQFTEIDIAGSGDVSESELRDRVAAAVGPDYDVDTGAAVADENQAAFGEFIGFIRNIMLVFAGISLFVSAFVITNVFSILVAQRTKELAMLRAIGARAAQVRRSVIAEALVIGLLASILGLGLGIALASVLLALISAFGVDIATTTPSVGSNAVVASLLCGLLVTLVASLGPARKAARVAPLAAMRDVAVEKTEVSKTRLALGTISLIVGGGLIAIGLLVDMDDPFIPVALGAAVSFLAVAWLTPTFTRPVLRFVGWPVAGLRGVSGSLARENAMRSPRRTASTASALMIGVALVSLGAVVFGSLRASIVDAVEEQFRGDLVVQGPQSGFGGLSPELAPQIDALPETADVSPLRFTVLNIGDQSGEFASAVKPDTYQRIYEVDVLSGSFADLGPTALAVSKNTADSQDLQIGESVPVQFLGGEQQQFTIGAIFEPTETTPTTWFMSLSAYDANVVDKYDTSIAMKATPGTSVDQLKSVVEAVSAGYPNAQVQDLDAVKDTFVSQINTVLFIFYGLLALAVIIALMGIATTLALSVFERTHEIGLLRAIGATRRQIRTSIRWESILVSVFGTILGLVIGVSFALALVASVADEGLTTLYVPVGTLVAIVIIAIVAGVIAAIWPARRAARLNVLNAIATT